MTTASDLRIPPIRLHDEAEVWLAQQDPLQQIVNDINDIQSTAYDPGIFEFFVKAYQEIVTCVADRVAEGVSDLPAVGLLLHQAADSWDLEEKYISRFLTEGK